MAQYVNCGSTPAALGSVSVLSTLVGDCDAQEAAVGMATPSMTTSATTMATASPTVQPSGNAAASATGTADNSSGAVRVAGGLARPGIAFIVAAMGVCYLI